MHIIYCVSYYRKEIFQVYYDAEKARNKGLIGDSYPQQILQHKFIKVSNKCHKKNFFYLYF